jgi:hypothetical protein
MANIFTHAFEDATGLTLGGGAAIAAGEGIGGTNALLVPASGTATFPCASNIDPNKGTIVMWVKPTWDGKPLSSSNGGNKSFFFTQLNALTSFRVETMAGTYGISYVRIEFYIPIAGVSTQYRILGYPPICAEWEAGQWHKLRVFWDFTLGAGLNYITGQVDGIFLNLGDAKELPEVNGGESIVLADGAVFYLGGNGSATRNIDGYIDSIDIDDSSLIAVNPADVYQVADPWVVGSDAEQKSLFSGDGFCSFWETHATEATDCLERSTGADVVFFQKGPLEFVYPGYVPTAGEIKTSMSYQAAKGENLNLWFNVHTKVALNNVVVTKSDFTGPETIGAANLDLRVVKNWYCGYGGNGLLQYYPGPLMHDDRVELETINPTDDPTLFHGSTWPYQSCPVLTQVETAFAASTAKQFSLNVKVPISAKAGVYSCTITIDADEIEAQTLTLSLEVVSFSLQVPAKIFSINYAALDADIYWMYQDETYNEWETRVTSYLQNLYDHGMNTLMLYGGYNFPYITKQRTPAEYEDDMYKFGKATIDIAVSIGFTGRIIVYVERPYFTWVYDYAVSKGFTEVIFWGGDELNFNQAEIDEYVLRWQAADALGAKIAVNTIKSRIDALDSTTYLHDTWGHPEGTYCPVHYPIYTLHTDAVGSGYVMELINGTEIKPTDKSYSYWWQIHRKDPMYNRKVYGNHIWLSDMDGAIANLHDAACLNCLNEVHQINLAFPILPTQEGFLPTMMWEAAKAGINDYKWLITWEYYYNRAITSYPDEAETSRVVVYALMEKWKFDPAWAAPSKDPETINQYDTDRTAIIEEVKSLQSLPIFTRGDYSSLPVDDGDLETIYAVDEIVDVAAVDIDMVPQSATSEFAIHQFQIDATGKTSVTITWTGQSNIGGLTSAVYLQVFDYTLVEAEYVGWTTVDSDNEFLANTDFTLSTYLADLTQYKDVNEIVTCRVYQEAK